MKLVTSAAGTRHRAGVVDAEGGVLRDATELLPAGAMSDAGPIAPSLRLLLITGDEDKVGPPEAGQELADAHGHATVEIMPVGHRTSLEAADPVTDHLLKFL
jgi:pimeloyl-ACP methyl ester carboxylesterase